MGNCTVSTNAYTLLPMVDEQGSIEKAAIGLSIATAPRGMWQLGRRFSYAYRLSYGAINLPWDGLNDRVLDRVQ